VTDSAKGLTIGQVAERTGLSVHALRFYEREGLLASEVERTPDGRRVYDEDDLEWLDLCVKLRSSGMPLAAIHRERSFSQRQTVRRWRRKGRREIPWYLAATRGDSDAG
jgi:hypothetical protein